MNTQAEITPTKQEHTHKRCCTCAYWLKMVDFRLCGIEQIGICSEHTDYITGKYHVMEENGMCPNWKPLEDLPKKVLMSALQRIFTRKRCN